MPCASSGSASMVQYYYHGLTVSIPLLLVHSYKQETDVWKCQDHDKAYVGHFLNPTLRQVL